MENHNKLAYADEKDKTYGITGMAITLVALDGEEYLAAIDLDAEAGEHLRMSHDFGFKGNPRMSAKIVWEQTLRDRLFESCMSYVDRIFRHAGIAGVADGFAERLARQRALSGSEAIEILASLGLR